MTVTILILLALFGGLAFALGLLFFLAWVTVAELWSIWKARNVRRTPLAFLTEYEMEGGREWEVDRDQFEKPALRLISDEKRWHQ